MGDWSWWEWLIACDIDSWNYFSFFSLFPSYNSFEVVFIDAKLGNGNFSQFQITSPIVFHNNFF